MKREICVIDATCGARDGLFTFIPVKDWESDNPTYITGLMYLSDAPPERMRFSGVFHEDGQEACEAFCKQYEKEIEQFIATREVEP